jgi:hypothetical protein
MYRCVLWVITLCRNAISWNSTNIKATEMCLTSTSLRTQAITVGYSYWDLLFTHSARDMGGGDVKYEVHSKTR